MVKAVKIISMIAGVFLLLMSILILSIQPGDDTYVGYIFGAVGLFFILVSFKYKGKVQPQKEPRYNAPHGNTSQSNATLHKFDMHRIVMQALETIDVISSTKNIDTLKSRLEFLKRLFEEIKQSYSHTDYRKQSLSTIDDYKQLYYDRTLLEDQAVAITSPSKFDFDEFACKSIFHCYQRNYTFQMEEINKLKTENGKQNRKQKLRENLDETIELLLKYNCPDGWIEKLNNYSI